MARYGIALVADVHDVYTVHMHAKSRLLAHAVSELEKNGLEGFSLRAVGAAAGLSPMAVYRHYRNREELLAAVGEEAFAAWKARLERIRVEHPLEWLRAAARAYVEFALDQPARFDACFVLRTTVERRYPADFRAGKSPVVSLLVARLEQAQARGLLSAGDPLEAGMIFWAQLHGLAMLHRSGRFALKRKDYLALCARCFEHALAGLGRKA